MEKVVFFLIVLSFLLQACGGVPPTNPGGYIVTFADGSEKFLDYQFCYTSTGTNIYASAKALFVECGYWSTNNTMSATFVMEYKAQITSFMKK